MRAGLIATSLAVLVGTAGPGAHAGAERDREPAAAEALGIRSRHFEQRDDTLSCALAGDYPVLSPDRANAEAFNASVQAAIGPTIDGFCATFGTDDPTSINPYGGQTSTLDISYAIGIASPRLVSIWFDIDEYGAGAPHNNTRSLSLHLALDKGRPVTTSDLFAAGADWARAIADRTLSELRRQEIEEGPFLDDAAPEIVAETVHDLSRWRFGRDHAEIVFDPYTIAGYPAGRRTVGIPYAVLRRYLSPDSLPTFNHP